MLSSREILTALETGCIYALVALALFLSFRVLNIADMTTNGAFTLGAAVGAMVSIAGYPLLAFPAAMLAGSAAGFITALLQTKFGIPSILAGIITDTGLYTVNLAVMGSAYAGLGKKNETLFTMCKSLLAGLAEKVPALSFLTDYYKLLPAALITLFMAILVMMFLKTRLGLSIRATGDNPDMVRASSINTSFTITVGLCIANACTALSGALIAQYQKAADINVGGGMVIIGLASLIIGEALLPKGKTWIRVLAVVLGSVIYRFIMAFALSILPSPEYLKLISAVIVALAIGLPALKSAKGGKVKC